MTTDSETELAYVKFLFRSIARYDDKQIALARLHRLTWSYWCSLIGSVYFHKKNANIWGEFTFHGHVKAIAILTFYEAQIALFKDPVHTAQ
jgi:hypothetical protein